MATSKTINPTNQTVSIPAFTDQPDARVFSNGIDKSIDGINKNYTDIGKIQSSLAIVATGNTHVAINAGQYVYVKGHSTLNDGLYIASSNIAANSTLSSSNLTADSSGGLNSLNDQIANICGYGTNTNGTYMKFPDGVMICTKKVTDSVALTNSWGSLYYGTCSLGSWPASFYATPTVQATLTGSSGGVLSSVANTDGSNIGSVDIARPNSGTYSYTVNIVGIGRWKA